MKTPLTPIPNDTHPAQNKALQHLFKYTCCDSLATILSPIC